MLFINLMTLKPHLTRQEIDQVSQRRARWRAPNGLDLVAEYWVQGSPQVISIVSAESVGPVHAANYPWTDVFDIETHPAMPVEEALRALQVAGIIKRRGRRPKALVEAMRAVSGT